MPCVELKSREDRESVFLCAVVMRFAATGATRHRVRNLSDGGACIDQPGELRAGQTVLIDIGEVEELGATVRWVSGGLAGLQFAHPIQRGSAKSRPRPQHLREGWTALPRR